MTTLAALATLAGALGLAACSGDPTPPASPTPSTSPAAHVLVVSYAAEFRHSSIPDAESTVAAIGRETGWFDVVHARTQDDVRRHVTSEGLRPFDTVVFANTTGHLGIPDLDAFLSWIQAGHAFLGVHSASDTYHGEPRYLEMLGNEFETHGEQAEVEIAVDDRMHPATAGLPPRFRIRDEIYRFRSNNRPSVGMLLSLDRVPEDGLPRAGEPGDLPIAWRKAYGNGRVFYTALGHREDVWQDPRFRQHLRGALQWALQRP